MTATTVDPVTFEILRHRLWAINDEAATTIGLVSGSQVVTEANDLNSALLSAEGDVIVCGMYILVHVAALDGVVKHIIATYGDNPGINPGDMFITNDPYLGATHQPDVIVAAPIFDGDRLIAWAGTCVHQADVGGPVPASIGVGARTIFEEAMPMAPMKIVEGGTIRRDVEREYLIRSRTPELNALDLLGQIAANRLQTERVLELCAQYGTDVILATVGRLVDSTEAMLRRRLAALPDGRWRHVAFVEHDGVDDEVYAVRLTMTKTGDRLVADFRETDPQCRGSINGTLGTLRSFVLSAAMPLLGYGLPWVPAAFWRVLELEVTHGSIVHARWPAAVSLGGTAVGHEIRSCMNVCLARMLDASEDEAPHVMASTMSSAPGQTITGIRADGVGFSSQLLDAMLGGGGARTFADGVDTSGLLHSPGGACANIEMTEHHYPIRYLWRRDRPDSGGPGRYRGGLGAEHAYVPHGCAGPIETTVYAHGVEHLAGVGVLGGEPGLPNGFALHEGAAAGATAAAEWDLAGPETTVLPAKAVTTIGLDDVYRSFCGGGGGLGDPLDRPAEEVRADVHEGVVSVDGARRDFWVVVDVRDGAVVIDEDATAAARAEARTARLGGRRPSPPATEPVEGRRLSRSLVVRGSGADGTVACSHCGHDVGPAGENLKDRLVRTAVPVDDRWAFTGRLEGSHRFELRRFFCPGCATQLDVEVNRRDAPTVWSTEVLGA